VKKLIGKRATKYNNCTEDCIEGCPPTALFAVDITGRNDNRQKENRTRNVN
jgi:hypothetical protein